MDLRELCLGFTGAEETYPFGPATTVFKVRVESLPKRIRDDLGRP